MGKQGSFIKRLTDLFFSLTILIISSPFLIIAALAIKIDSKGPIFFVQRRTGFNGKSFKMIKFRGMVNNALEVGPELTQKDDPRITRVGKFLRRTSIDEIPQVINVLKGEMSIVGPRPEIISITNKYTNKQKLIFNCKPGITGFSQIHGRQLLTPEERIAMELDYYANAGFWTDLIVALKTISVIVSNKGNL
jgi:lipopolysaccharide/colanic/teichoic acid biosynthesis glycosyltransferase